MNPHTLGDRVVIKLDAPETETSSGLIIPSNAQEGSITGTVRAVSEPGILMGNGEYRPVGVEVGDKVLVKRYTGTEMRLQFEGEEEDMYEVFRENDILLKWEE